MRSKFQCKSPLSVAQILGWADAHFERTGDWPTVNSGPVIGARQEKWTNINANLRDGDRGLPAGWSLTQLLAEHRGKRNRLALPAFTVAQILDWADTHHELTGKWPNSKTGPIPGTGETWKAVQQALSLGTRGMPGGSSLHRLLKKRRGATNPRTRPPLTVTTVLVWADAHYQRTGNWPRHNSGPIFGTASETWMGVHHDLLRGKRGLRVQMSLAELLFHHRGVQLYMRQPPLKVDQIRAWAETHRTRTGRWPMTASGPIPEAPGESWSRIDAALKQGKRGVKRRMTLAEFLTGRPKRSYIRGRPLTESKILAWADAYRRRHGCWPNRASGVIPGASGETWQRIDCALLRGNRGLEPGASLYRLLKQNRLDR